MYQPPPSTATWSRSRTGWWVALTALAGAISGVGGYARFQLVCAKICGPPQPGIWTWIPGYDESIEEGAAVAGILAPILVIMMQSIMVGSAIRKPMWMLTLFPSVFFSLISTQIIINISTSRTDVIDPLSELAVVGMALIPIGLAGFNIGISYAFALDVREKGTLARAMARAWVLGWFVFGLLVVLPVVDGALEIGWLLCWLFVGMQSAVAMRRALDQP